MCEITKESRAFFSDIQNVRYHSENSGKVNLPFFFCLTQLLCMAMGDNTDTCDIPVAKSKLFGRNLVLKCKN